MERKFFLYHLLFEIWLDRLILSQDPLVGHQMYRSIEASDLNILQKLAEIGFEDGKNRIVHTLKGFVEKLKRGILTNVNEHGSRLSGGQLQRLSIARALYSNADIVVMDEITNSLDSKTEDMVINNLSQIKSKCTIVLVSHNLKVLKNCDRVFKLVKNKLSKTLI
jgi:ABC-type bacteriocin/lantibiotic exporter with double-glycine peptidase domain